MTREGDEEKTSALRMSVQGEGICRGAAKLGGKQSLLDGFWKESNSLDVWCSGLVWPVCSSLVGHWRGGGGVLGVLAGMFSILTPVLAPLFWLRANVEAHDPQQRGPFAASPDLS